MLARIASSLYWTGRYLERSEHLARYLRVQYFSMLDAPMSQSKEFTLNSILNMYGCEWPEGEPLTEAAVLRQVAMDYNTSSSIRATLRLARQNGTSLRHVIPTELWETINAYYLYSNNYDPDYFVSHGLYDYTTEVSRHCAVIRSRIDDTLLHDRTWVFIKIGIHLERAIQVLRMLHSKLIDVDKMAERDANPTLRQYQGTVILKIAEGFDIYRRVNNEPPTPSTLIAFLVAHPQFPRSATYNMRRVHELLERMDGNSPEHNPLLFRVGKIYTYFRYLEYSEIREDTVGALSRALEQVSEVHAAIERMYFPNV